MSEEIEDEFDVCSICRNKGSEECGGCEIPHACLNCFQPDKSKVINPEIELYAHWVTCIREKCPESKDGECGAGMFTHEGCPPVRVTVPFPKGDKCLFPNYIPISRLKEDNLIGAYEPSVKQSSERDDIPF